MLLHVRRVLQRMGEAYLDCFFEGHEERALLNRTGYDPVHLGDDLNRDEDHRVRLARATPVGPPPTQATSVLWFQWVRSGEGVFAAMLAASLYFFFPVSVAEPIAIRSLIFSRICGVTPSTLVIS